MKFLKVGLIIAQVSGKLCLEKYAYNKVQSSLGIVVYDKRCFLSRFKDCAVDFGELGRFSTEYPWSDVNPFSDNAFGILGPRPAVLPNHPDSIQTYFRPRSNFLVSN